MSGGLVGDGTSRVPHGARRSTMRRRSRPPRWSTLLSAALVPALVPALVAATAIVAGGVRSLPTRASFTAGRLTAASSPARPASHPAIKYVPSDDCGALIGVHRETVVHQYGQVAPGLTV